MPKFMDNRRQILRHIDEREMREGNEREVNDTIDFLVSEHGIPEQVASYALKRFRPVHALSIAAILGEYTEFSAKEGFDIAQLSREHGIAYEDGFILASGFKHLRIPYEQGFGEYAREKKAKEGYLAARREAALHEDGLVNRLEGKGLSQSDARYLVEKFGDEAVAPGFALHYHLEARSFEDIIEEDRLRISPAMVMDEAIRMRRSPTAIPISSLNPASHKKVANLLEGGDHNGEYEPLGKDWESDYGTTRADQYR